MADGQVDFEPDRAGTAWRLAVALAASAVAVWLILAGGVFGAILGLPVLAVSGFFAVTLAEDVSRRGPVVSVGPRGVFDRRVSGDWIGWEWFGDVQPCRWPRTIAFLLYFHPGSETALPVRARARLLSWVNWVKRPGVRWLFTEQLAGQVPALAAAIDRFSGGRFAVARQIAVKF